MARPSPQSASGSETSARTHPPADTGAQKRRPGDAPVSEDLLIRNYDVERRYTLHVSAADPESGTAFEWTYYLDPGEFRSEIGVLEPGTYEITVETESCGRATTTCTIGSAPTETALVETGNLSVAVSDEIY